MRVSIALAGALALATAGATPAHAHHSFAMFDMDRELTLTGTVKSFQWTNPHCYIQLTVPGANGKPVEWSLEMGAPMYLYAKGWRPRTLKPGDALTVRINPLRSGQNGGVVIEATTPDGETLGNKRGP